MKHPEFNAVQHSKLALKFFCEYSKNSQTIDNLLLKKAFL